MKKRTFNSNNFFDDYNKLTPFVYYFSTSLIHVREGLSWNFIRRFFEDVKITLEGATKNIVMNIALD